MPEQIKGIWEKVKTAVSGMSKRVRNIIIATVALVIVLLIGLAVYRATRPYKVLFSGLSSEDMTKVMTFLESNNVTNYRVQGGDTISVPKDMESSLRMQLALQQSYPTSGFSYSTYLDNVGLLSSDADRRQLQLFETMERLAASIKTLDVVKEAHVNLDLGDDSRYILDSSNIKSATASVTLSLQNGRSLSSNEANAIRSIVSYGVAGLVIENVLITDQAGNVYSGDEIANASDAAALKMSLETQVNSQVRASVMAVLEPMFGAENLRISVKSTVDVARTYEESIKYHPPEETNWDSLGGHGLIGEWVYDNSVLRTEAGGTGGAVGTTTNADLYEYITDPDNLRGNENSLGVSGSIEYNHDQTTTQKEYSGGVITDIMVSVTVNSSVARNMNISDLIGHVGRAAGISTEQQEEKVSIISAPFRTPDATPEPAGTKYPAWMLYALIGGVVLFILLLILILVLRSKAKKRRLAKLAAEAEAAAEAAAAMAIPEGPDIMKLPPEPDMELRQDVQSFADENPEIAAQMIKAWLKGSEDRK